MKIKAVIKFVFDKTKQLLCFLLDAFTKGCQGHAAMIDELWDE